MNLASRIKQRRIELKMTQTKLAELSGVSQQAINRIESGIIARPRYLLEMAQALECSASWLVNGDNPNEKA
ncbi:helix-turn-helix transcriptional regulator [Serratia nevei]|uniref:helix-turn-helix domain-containing protein n=1 Tax=Serratia nevei TaxID=2703794 RepID=UPI003016C82D